MQTMPLSPEHDAFWETIGPFLFSPQRVAAAPTEVTSLLTLLGLQAPATVLDLCCGMGRHTVELARRGFAVTGVDKTSAYLASAARQAAAEGLSVEWVQAAMESFRRERPFDVVVNLFTSFGYGETPEDDARVVRNVYDSLKGGGAVLLDVVGKEVLARQFRERDWRETAEGLVVEERTIIKNWGGIANRWIILSGDRRTELRFSHRLYSAGELTTLLQRCGFPQVAVYGDLAGSAYDQGATRLVVVAHK